MEKCECSQCGSTDFNKEKNDYLRCVHCRSLFRLIPEQKSKSGGGVIIKKGANVTFGKNSNVIIKGKLTVEDGANVSFNGKLEIIEKASVEDIKKAKAFLQLQKNKDS